MHRRIFAHEYLHTDDTRFAVAPERTGNPAIRWLDDQVQPVLLQESAQLFDRQVAHTQNVWVRLAQSLNAAELFQDDSHQIVDQRVTHELLFPGLAKHECFIVRVIACLGDELAWLQHFCATGDTVFH